jgi:hypothetical protein
MPDWYREALIGRYQYLVDEFDGLNRKHLWNSSGGIDVVIFATLSYLAFDNLWALLLAALGTASIWNGREQHKRFLVAHQMMAIEAEWPDVRENVAFPAPKS